MRTAIEIIAGTLCGLALIYSHNFTIWLIRKIKDGDDGHQG